MAVLKIVAIRDTAVAAFMPPVFTPSIGGFLRAVGDEARKDGSPLNLHPDNYQVYRLGEFDEESGKFVLLESPEQIARVQDMVSRAQ